MTKWFWLNLSPFPEKLYSDISTKLISLYSIDYEVQIPQETYDCVLTYVNFLYCVTQNIYIVQIYYHSVVDFSNEWGRNFQ